MTTSGELLGGGVFWVMFGGREGEGGGGRGREGKEGELKGREGGREGER